MRILLINHYAGSPKHGMEFRPFYLAREWVRLGHEVTIVAASQSHLRIATPQTDGSITEEAIEGIRYVWLKTPRYQGNGVRRAINMSAFVGQLFRFHGRILRQWSPDVVIASSTYPLDILPARRIAAKHGAKLVFEVHDLWPLTPMELGGMSPWHPFIALLQRAENFAYRRSDHVVSMLPKADGHMREHGMADHKFAHIPNGIDPDEWQSNASPLPDEHRRTPTDLKQQGRFVIAYAGGHSVSNSLGTLIEAARLLQDDPVSFVLVGQGLEKESLQQRARELGSNNVVFLPPVAKTSIPALLAEFDALYLGWSRRPIYRFGISPNKLIDYMMSGKPVIHAVDAGNDLVAESGCGISCPPEDPRALADAVVEMINLEPAEREAMGRRGKDHIMRHYTYADLASRFLEVVA